MSDLSRQVARGVQRAMQVEITRLRDDLASRCGCRFPTELPEHEPCAPTVFTAECLTLRARVVALAHERDVLLGQAIVDRAEAETLRADAERVRARELAHVVQACARLQAARGRDELLSEVRHLKEWATSRAWCGPTDSAPTEETDHAK